MNPAEASRLICLERIERGSNYPVAVGIVNLPIGNLSVGLGQQTTADMKKEKADLPLEGKWDPRGLDQIYDPCALARYRRIVQIRHGPCGDHYVAPFPLQFVLCQLQSVLEPGRAASQ